MTKILNLIKRLPIDLGQGYYRHTTKAKLMAFAAAGKPHDRSNQALDFGCGDGYWSNQLKSRGWKVTSTDGYDFRYPGTIEVDAEQPLPFADNSFDLIWSVEVIEHVRNVKPLVQEFRRILRPGGKIIITTPNSAFWLYALLNVFGITPAQVQNPDHKQFFDLRAIHQLFPGAKVMGFFPYAILKIPIRQGIALLSPTFVIISPKT